MSKYDLLFGVATADAMSFLSGEQLEYGMSIQVNKYPPLTPFFAFTICALQTRNNLLSDFVSELYPVHQREIFSAIVTEYTDWQTPNQWVLFY